MNTEFKRHRFLLNAGIILCLLFDKFKNELLLLSQEPRTREEIMEKCGISSRNYFRLNILYPILESGLLNMTVLDKPNSPNQKYISR